MSGPRKISMKICCGSQLMPMDLTGKSDPYVKVMLGDQVIYKSKKVKKSLDPEWNEQFSATVQDSSLPVTLNVFDFDRVAGNDFMGKADIDLEQFDYQGSEEVVLELQHANDSDLLKKLSKETQTLGRITVRIAVSPQVESESPVSGSHTTVDPRKVSFISDRAHSKDKPLVTGMVRVVVVQARGLLPPMGEDQVTASCSVVLGNRKYKTKPVTSFNPKWREAFTLPWYEGQDDFVELVLMDSSGKNSGSPQKLGRSFIDLKHLEREKTHNLWLPLKDRLPGQLSELENSEKWLDVSMEGEIHVLATISGTPAGLETSTHIHPAEICGVGLLTVEVVRAVGLDKKSDWKGKERSPFIALQVGNSRLQTQTVEDTVDPYFGRTLHFDIDDVSEVLEVTVFDDNEELEAEFLGKVKIPLLNIGTGGEKWFRLKCQKSRNAADGNQPRVLLGINLQFQRLKACAALLKPVSIKYDDQEETREFDFAVFKRNAQRLNSVKAKMASFKSNIKSIIAWEDPFRSSYGLLTYILAVWYLELWMLPLLPLLYMTVYLCKPERRGFETQDEDEDEKCDDCESDMEEVPEGEEWKFTDKIKELMQKAFWMQEMMGSAADKVEKIQNIFNFRVPFISGLLYCILIAVMVFLYFVPLRVLLLVFGLNKFRKGLLNIQSTPGKLRCLVSRVPNDEELRDVEELPSVCEDPERLETLRRNASKDSDVI